MAWGGPNPNHFRHVEWDVLAVPAGMPFNEAFLREQKLVICALNVLSVPGDATKAGCRFKDDASGIELVWRLV